MTYPTMEQVEKADRVQLARWQRFLPSPGESVILLQPKQFQAVLDREEPILSRILERFAAMGGFTPAISKEIGGWGNNDVQTLP